MKSSVLARLAQFPVLVGGLFVLWQVLYSLEVFPKTQFTSPVLVAKTIAELLREGTLAPRVVGSVGRLVAGASLGLVLGVLSGIATARFLVLERWLNPIVAIFAPIPVVIWVPLAILVFGLGFTYQLSLVALTTFLLVHLHTYLGAAKARRRFSSLVQIYQLSFQARIRHILLPAVIPDVLTALRVALVMGWIVLFMVEYGTASSAAGGLAYFIRQERAVGRIEDQFAGVVVLAAVAFFLDFVIVVLRAFAERWDVGGEGHAL